MSETPIQVLQNGQGRFRSEIEELLDKRSREVVHAVRQLIQDHIVLKNERDEARQLAREVRDALTRLRSQMQIADNDHELTVRVFQIPSGEVRRADLFLTRAKEVLL